MKPEDATAKLSELAQVDLSKAWVDTNLEVRQVSWLGRLWYSFFGKPERLKLDNVAKAIGKFLTDHKEALGPKADDLAALKGKLSTFGATHEKHATTLEPAIRAISTIRAEETVGPRDFQEISNSLLRPLREHFGEEVVTKALDELFGPREKGFIEEEGGPHLLGGINVVRGRCVDLFLRDLEETKGTYAVATALQLVLKDKVLRTTVLGRLPNTLADGTKEHVADVFSQLVRSDFQLTAVEASLRDELGDDWGELVADLPGKGELDTLAYAQWEVIEANATNIRAALP